MLHQKSVASASRVAPHFSLKRHRRAVHVSVIVGGREEDSFEVAHPETLRTALTMIKPHLPAGKGEIRFRAVEEEWLPFGLARARRESPLAGPGDALAYIAA